MDVYHGGSFLRAILVLLLFLIGEVFVVYLAIVEQLTGEHADRIAERAISASRVRLKGGAGVGSALTDTSNAGG